MLLQQAATAQQTLVFLLVLIIGAARRARRDQQQLLQQQRYQAEQLRYQVERQQPMRPSATLATPNLAAKAVRERWQPLRHS
jgi:hypothetical protein